MAIPVELLGQNTFKIPLVNIPQTFQISLAGKNYIALCRWNNSPEAGWVMDFADQVTGLPIVGNIPLITGADCLSGLGYLGFNGSLFVFTDGDDDAVPTLENLGIESNLYFVTDFTGG